MYEYIWLTLTLLLLFKICLAVVQISYSLNFILKSQNESIRKTSPVNESVNLNLFIVIPLLREQKIINELYQRFVGFVKGSKEINLVFITTEREIIENDNNEKGTTIEILKRLIKSSSDEVQNKIIHLHYPENNTVVAEQLNYAFEYINRLEEENTATYALIYNADSVIEDTSVAEMLKKTYENVDIVQQSSLFLWNTPDLLRERKFLLTCFALYQSSWTLQHELSRYLFSKKKLPYLPKRIEENSLIHCVTHGLLIKPNLLTNAGGFPVTRFGGEDLALGFVLKVMGYHVEPLTSLENTEIPNSYKVLFKQLAGWYLGTLGYFVFWSFVPAKAKRERYFSLFTVTLLGIYDSMKWLFKGILILFYIFLGYITGCLGLSVILYLLYFYISLVGVVWLWYKLPDQIFPKPSKKALFASFLFYWLVPILRSMPAFLGVYWGIKNALGYSFIKPKTER
jgi:hypothetical protein